MTENERIIEKYDGIDKIQSFYYSDSNNNLIKDVIFPNKIDNRHITAPTDNQYQTSQCACYSICNMFESYYWKFTGKLINLNPEQVYAGAKLLDGMKNSDGTFLECAINSAWDLCGFKGQPQIQFVYNNHNKEYVISQLKRAVHSFDFVHAGFNVKQNWFNKNKNDYIINNSGNVIGGHAVLINYYDTENFGIQNSWGKEWAASGMALIPNDILMDQMIYCCYITNIYNQFI